MERGSSIRAFPKIDARQDLLKRLPTKKQASDKNQISLVNMLLLTQQHYFHILRDLGNPESHCNFIDKQDILLLPNQMVAAPEISLKISFSTKVLLTGKNLPFGRWSNKGEFADQGKACQPED